MFDRRMGLGGGMLGQVPIREGTGFTGPFGAFGQPPTQGYYRAPSGAPLYSEEERSPSHVGEEKHCYSCPDGTKQYLTIAEARAMACEARPVDECGGGMPRAASAPPALYGRRMGASHAAPVVSSQSPAPSSGGRIPMQNFFTPPFPDLVYPAASPNLVCKKETTSEGEELWHCQPEAPPPGRFPVVFFRPLF